MTRNTEMHFKNTPSINIERSKFDMSCSHKTTLNVGDIVPIYMDMDILPGDTVQMDLASLVRMATPIYPVMDNAFMDTYAFFVPHRLVMDHWAEFWGENEDQWTQQTEYEIPMIGAPTNGWQEGTLADYMGVPTKVGNIEVSALPFRAYAKIFNDWFRNENTNNNCHIYMDEAKRTGQNGTETGYSYVTGVELGGKPAKAAKLHDYFTSALPQPQKGDAVLLPLGQTAPVTGTATGTVPAHTATGTLPFRDLKLRVRNTEYTPSDISTNLKVYTTGDTALQNVALIGTRANGSHSANIGVNTNGSLSGSSMGDIRGFTNLYAQDDERTLTSNVAQQNLNINFNAVADLSAATAATVNALRTAFALQKYFENAGLHGTRYIEYIRSVFGVTSSDARMQRAEYLGGKRTPINMDQILQTSSTDQTSPQGNTAGFSCTIDKQDLFTKSFEEHGTLMVLAVIRVEHSYQQGIERMWSRKKWSQFYNPFFAHLGEDGILLKELWARGTEADDEVFGYQERWAEYRYKQNRVSGYMRSNANGSLDVWHYADNYTERPYLSSGWMLEPQENVDRTIAVTSALTHQFIGDFFFKSYYTRPMPVYSVPGLIDHV